ncbi:uncharacterized protein [Dysidea avara]|uniref:uncharacterized protein n=1 Tax=Dysidea avara TaxID=196820 RepID=UPI003332F8CE
MISQSGKRGYTQLKVGVQTHITNAHLKKLTPLVKDITDFDDSNAGRLTVEVLGALTYILCENKTKPDHEQLLKLTPLTVDLDGVVCDIKEKLKLSISSKLINLKKSHLCC